MVTNEKQTKIESNLLRLMRKALNLLGANEAIFDLVCRMNTEEISPLKGRIMVGSGKIRKGYKELQLSKILEDSSVFQRLEAENFDSLDSKCKLLSIYLHAWEHVYGVSFQAPIGATLTKISGIRYILYLLPTILEILKNNNTAPTEKSFREMIQKLPLATGVSDVFTDPSTVLAFRGGSATVKLAKEHSTSLMKHATATKPNFDLSEGFK